tara:strand:- start:207 stop:548 length:342 start_codon:yes stop_codon:yes gene_type:complete
MVMSKQKGNRVERLIVDIFKEYNWDVRRAWGSNGQALGHHEEVDIAAKHPVIYNGKEMPELKVQVKARKKVAEYIKPNTEVVDWQVLKEDRQDPLVILPLHDLLAIIGIIAGE